MGLPLPQGPQLQSNFHTAESSRPHKLKRFARRPAVADPSRMEISWLSSPGVQFSASISRRQFHGLGTSAIFLPR
jgi:hypothetical protein